MGKKDDEDNFCLNSELVNMEHVSMELGEITLEEIKYRLKKFKRRKAPGPDDIPMEVFLEMGDDNLEVIKRTPNEWWLAGNSTR